MVTKSFESLGAAGEHRLQFLQSEPRAFAIPKVEIIEKLRAQSGRVFRVQLLGAGDERLGLLRQGRTLLHQRDSEVAPDPRRFRMAFGFARVEIETRAGVRYRSS